MKIRFLGAAGTVTGSRYLLSHDNTNLLIDCGLFQGVKNVRQRNWQAFPFPAGNIQAVVLTHAHLDHSGYLPRLLREGFRGQVHATRATRELASILLADSAHLQEEDARRANRYGYSKHEPAEPLYTSEDAEHAMKIFVTHDYHETFNVGPFRISFSRAGHILGSACVRVECAGKSITFSGDVGRPDDPVMKAPDDLAATDFLVVESTYGDRTHPADDVMEVMAGIVNDTVSNGGTVLIPAFAVGRTQVLMHLLTELMEQNRIPSLPIYLDSPMAIDVTDVFRHHRAEHRLSPTQCEAMQARVIYTATVEQSQALSANPHPKIIIAGAGMLTGGRILHHLMSFGDNHRHTIVIAGYQAGGTRGDALLRGTRSLRIYGQEVPIACRVAQINELSAHADAQEMQDWLDQMPGAPRHVFVTHGEPVAADTLRQKLGRHFGWKIDVPEQGDSFGLD
ncbi:MAG: MBL fold metallo-hydrolase [Moraxellaceae bacterium]|nr:MBL fold metallo-hydrolase [Moraxellaceae bacterium]